MLPEGCENVIPSHLREKMTFPLNIWCLAHILSTLNEFSCSRYASGEHEKSCRYDNEHFITLKIPYIERE